MTKHDTLNEYGWLIAKGVFSEEEIKEIREITLSEKNKSHKGDLLSNPNLFHVISDARILDLARECLSNDEILYFGDSTYTIDTVGNGFHKDCRRRDDPTNPDYSDKDYSLIRMGIYLQDHSQHSGGLCLRSKSHTTHSLNKGKIINVRSNVGDVIVWKLTTSHAANATVISLFPDIGFHPVIARRAFPNFMKQKKIKPRSALFMAFGLNDRHFQPYMDFIEGTYAKKLWDNSNYSTEQMAAMTTKNVIVQKAG